MALSGPTAAKSHSHICNVLKLGMSLISVLKILGLSKIRWNSPVLTTITFIISSQCRRENRAKGHVFIKCEVACMFWPESRCWEAQTPLVSNCSAPQCLIKWTHIRHGEVPRLVGRKKGIKCCCQMETTSLLGFKKKQPYFPICQS